MHGSGSADQKNHRIVATRRGGTEAIDQALFQVPSHTQVQTRAQDSVAAGVGSDARILTDRGRVAAGSLKAGDMVWTFDNGLRALKWALHRPVTLMPKTEFARPIRIDAGAFGAGKPTRDLVVAPGQRVLLSDWRIKTYLGLDQVLVTAVDLLGHPGVSRDYNVDNQSYTYLQFRNFELIEVDGVVSESFMNDRRFSVFASGPLRNAAALGPTRPLLLAAQAQMLGRIDLDAKSKL